MTMSLGRVVAVHPEDNSVDLVMVADNARMVAVQVLSGAASGSTGLADLTDPLPANDADKWDRFTPTARDITAVVGYIGRHPVVVGFLFPQVSQVLFARTNFRVDRHASDAYSTLDEGGNFEWAHPSGTFVRVAESPEHEDLTGMDFDGRWAIGRNTDTAPWLSIMVKAAGVEAARLRIDPMGNVTLAHAGNLAVQTAGAASFDVTSDVTVNAGGSTTVNGTGAVTITSQDSVQIQAPSFTVTGG